MRRRRRRGELEHLVRHLLLIAALLAPSSVFAEGAEQGVVEKTPFERLEIAASAIDDIDKKLATDKLTQDELLALKEELNPLADELSAIVSDIEPWIEGIDARLEQLGKTPAAGEDPSVTADRQQEIKKRQQWDDALKRAKLLEIRARELVELVAKHRRQLFSSELSARTTSILGLAYWRDVKRNLPIDLRRFGFRYDEGVRALANAMTDETRNELLLMCFFGLLIAIVGPLFTHRLGEKLALRYLPDNHLRRTLFAIWTVITFVSFPVIGANLVTDVLEDTQALTPLMATIVATLVTAVRIIMLVTSLARAWLQPGNAQWRLVWWSDKQVAMLRGLPTAIAVLVACRVLWERINDAAGTSLHVSILGRTIIAMAILVVVAITLSRLGAIRHELIAQPPKRRDVDEPLNPVPGALLSGVAWICVFTAPVALVLGYNAFAIFLVREITQVGLVLAALMLLMRLADDIFEALLSDDFPLGRLLRRSIGFSAAYIDQTAVVLAAASRVALVYVAVRLVLLRLGGEDVTSVAGRIQEGLTDLKVGEVTISPGAIAGALLVFTFVWLLTRTVRRWLENRYLPHTSLDTGARNSLSTGIGYLGFIGAVLMAVAYLGVSLDKVALIASALSVGVGFGLQAIISNFVSGLILLVERPIKVGDLVNVGGTTGDVKKISVRATEITLGDGSTYVVPNSDLISKPVVNKTRIGVIGQVQFLLRIAYGEDPNRAREVILEEAGKLDKILKRPGPNVFIDDVDDRGFVMNIVASVGSPRDTYGAKSDLFFAITRRLRAEHIALGSPIASVEADQGAAGGEQSETESEPAPEPEAVPPPSVDDADRPALGDGKGAVDGAKSGS
jgi:potassium efflux system protein